MPEEELSGSRPKARYGIGEWFGRLFLRMTPSQRRGVAGLLSLPKNRRRIPICPFKRRSGELCTKEGGVCSLRSYQQDPETGAVSVAPGKRGALVTICPYRFEQNSLVFRWIGKTLLDTEEALIIGEIGFLERETSAEDVGRIDNVLVHPNLDFFKWCALEIQAVYFSGASMNKEFDLIRRRRAAGTPFPGGHRRPDFRSSGPKRLMPQLQIKVPTLRRWGKKMAVVVDRPFFDAMGQMDDVKDVSNCDIAWFVVKYQETAGQAILTKDFVRYTTLERAVEGLTGGQPVSLGVFEERIREKLARHRNYPAASPGAC